MGNISAGVVILTLPPSLVSVLIARQIIGLPRPLVLAIAAGALFNTAVMIPKDFLGDEGPKVVVRDLPDGYRDAIGSYDQSYTMTLSDGTEWVVSKNKNEMIDEIFYSNVFFHTGTTNMYKIWYVVQADGTVHVNRFQENLSDVTIQSNSKQVAGDEIEATNVSVSETLTIVVEGTTYTNVVDRIPTYSIRSGQTVSERTAFRFVVEGDTIFVYDRYDVNSASDDVSEALAALDGRQYFEDTDRQVWVLLLAPLLSIPLIYLDGAAAKFTFLALHSGVFFTRQALPSLFPYAPALGVDAINSFV